MYKISIKEFKIVCPKAKDPENWVKILNKTLWKYDITTEYRVKMFLAQTSHESAGFTALSENLNYSEKALKTVFGKYFRNVSAKPYARKPELIANLVYANRMGNGDEASGDGWKFRGRGVIQLTGYNNYKAFADSKSTEKFGVESAILLAETPMGCIQTAAWFWRENKLNKFADEKDVVGCTRAINGGYNGLEHRQKLWDGLQS